MPRATIFIDGAYLDFLPRDEFDHAKIDLMRSMARVHVQTLRAIT